MNPEADQEVEEEEEGVYSSSQTSFAPTLMCEDERDMLLSALSASLEKKVTTKTPITHTHTHTSLPLLLTLTLSE